MSNNTASQTVNAQEDAIIYNIIVISGPSGSGKSTLVKYLMERHPELEFSVSHTTRPIRGREVNGVDYHFVEREHFQRLIDEGAFVEYAEVYGNYYGTSFQEVETKGNWTTGKYLVLDIDIQGARIVRKRFPDALFVLVSPPSVQTLGERLARREGKLDDVIKNRLLIARGELEQFNFYDYIIINDRLEDAKSDMEAIYTAYRCKTFRKAPFMRKMLESEAGKLPITPKPRIAEEK